MQMTVNVDGICAERFEGVRDALAASLASGADTGASVAVIVDGDVVVDLWGGVADVGSGQPWSRDTVVNVFSTTKTMTALVALMLADRGELDVAASVSKYWPEFAAAGKEAVEVRHLLGHTSGLSGWEIPLTEEQFYDWDLVCSRLAEQAPWWDPGTASGYHAATQGFLIGEVVRRITGGTVRSFFADEIAGPLGADFQIGLRKEDYDRVATLIAPEMLPMEIEPGSVAARTVTNPPISADWTQHDGWREAEIPAANGHGNARSVALVQSALSTNGTVNGVRLLSDEGCRRVLEPQSSGADLVLGLPMTFGLGYGLSSEGLPFDAAPGAFFWGGWGGSLVVIDPAARMTFAFVMNRMGQGTVGDDRSASMLAATYRALSSR
jgi:CubicO group peptidase (beta-lactamase class C family)